MTYEPIVGNYVPLAHPPNPTVPCSFCQYASLQGGTRSHRAIVSLHGISPETHRLVQLSWCKDCLADMGLVVITTLADWDRARLSRPSRPAPSSTSTQVQPPCPG
jgi:hypothetical protein